MSNKDNEKFPNVTHYTQVDVQPGGINIQHVEHLHQADVLEALGIELEVKKKNDDADELRIKKEPMEQRGQSDACIDYAESRQRKTEGQELRIDDGEMPEALRGEEAEALWERLREAGFIESESYALAKGVSANQAAYIAAGLADQLGIKKKWQVFERLWGVKNLAQLAGSWQQTGKLPPKSREIDRLMQ